MAEIKKSLFEEIDVPLIPIVAQQHIVDLMHTIHCYLKFLEFLRQGFCLLS